MHAMARSLGEAGQICPHRFSQREEAALQKCLRTQPVFGAGHAFAVEGGAAVTSRGTAAINLRPTNRAHRAELNRMTLSSCG